VRRALTVTFAAFAAGIALAGCGGSGSTGATTESTSTSAFKGGTVDPVVAAPELGLKTFDGRTVRMADLRGKVALVTFVYTQCPDVCPLIVDNLIRVKRGLGPAGKRLRIVAVSVDPSGDTPAAIRKFLVAHRALGNVDYLVGSSKQLEATWARWGILARRSKDNPALIEHSGWVWGIDPQGRRATFYPAVGFDPVDIASDVRAMLGSS